ncbi:MAG: hypothetical protein QW407_07505 [Thermofilaceae archaeon]
MTEEIEPEKRLAVLAACVMLLSLKRSKAAVNAAARWGRFSSWVIAARLDAPSERWCTLKRGRHEKEV